MAFAISNVAFAAPTIFDQLSVKPVDGQTIVLATYNLFLGDVVAETYGKIAAIHRAYPHSKIKIVGPSVGVLRPSSWLELVPFVASGVPDDPNDVEGTNAALNSRGTLARAKLLFAPTDFVIVDGGTKVFQEAAAAEGAHGVLLTNRYWNDGGQLEVQVIGSPDGMSPTRRYSLGNPVGQSNIYADADATVRALWGDKAEWPPGYFIDEKTDLPRAHAALKEVLGDRAGKFCVLNLNTKGKWKLGLVGKNYVAMTQAMIEAALKADPHQAVLLASPEPQFAEYRRDIENLVRSYSGRVAFLPADRTTWLPIIRDSQYVISQDSGFVHLALVVKPETEVMTIGFDHPEKDYHPFEFWIKGMQSFLQMPSSGAMPKLAGVVRWMQRQLNPGAVSSDHALVALSDEALRIFHLAQEREAQTHESAEVVYRDLILNAPTADRRRAVADAFSAVCEARPRPLTLAISFLNELPPGPASDPAKTLLLHYISQTERTFAQQRQLLEPLLRNSPTIEETGPVIRERVLLGLLPYNGKGGHDALASLLKSPFIPVREAAGEALEQAIATGQFVPGNYGPILPGTINGSSDLYFADLIRESEETGPGAVAALRRLVLFFGDRPQVNREAAQALRGEDPARALAVFDALWPRQCSPEVLQAVPEFVEHLLQHSDWVSASRTVEMFPKLGQLDFRGKGELTPFVLMITHPDPAVREAAVAKLNSVRLSKSTTEAVQRQIARLRGQSVEGLEKLATSVGYTNFVYESGLQDLAGQAGCDKRGLEAAIMHLHTPILRNDSVH